VVEALAKKNALDSGGFATADDWMAETLTHRYPVALERIVRGHTHVTRNTASILVSLKNGYIHSGWIIKRGAALTKSGGTHAALRRPQFRRNFPQQFCANQRYLNQPRGPLFGGFQGRRDGRGPTGAEWTLAKNRTRDPTQPDRASVKNISANLTTVFDGTTSTLPSG